MKIGALLGGALLVAALPVGGASKLAIHVSPAVAYGPANLTIRLSVEPDAENRTLIVVAESQEFFRSSYLYLDGARAARTNMVRYQSVPAGDYQVRGILLDSRGETRATVSHNVMIVGKGGQ